MTVVPIHQLRRQLPEQGRIRIGRKGAKGAPVRLNTFRFTSHDELAIREIAKRYGGTPMPWADGPRAGEWEVVTETSRIPVLLPPFPLGEGEFETPIYEMWSGSGCLRRCDGETVKVPDRATDHTVETPCICNAKGVMECKPKTRLVVVLREIRFGGGWRIETGGKIAAEELPGMVDWLLSLQAQGVIAGELTMREERQTRNGRTNKFMVPMLATEASADELSAGQGQVQSLGPSPNHPTMQAIPGPQPDADTSPFLDETVTVIDVTPIDDIERLEEMLAPAAPPTPPRITAAEVSFFQACADLASLPECDGKSDDDVRHALVLLVTRGRATSSKELTDEERKNATELVIDILAGERRVLGFGAKGLRVSKKAEGA